MEERTGLFRVNVRLFQRFDADREPGVLLPIGTTASGRRRAGTRHRGVRALGFAMSATAAPRTPLTQRHGSTARDFADRPRSTNTRYRCRSSVPSCPCSGFRNRAPRWRTARRKGAPIGCGGGSSRRRGRHWIVRAHRKPMKSLPPFGISLFRRVVAIASATLTYPPPRKPRSAPLPGPCGLSDGLLA